MSQAYTTAIKAELRTAHTKVLVYQADKGRLPLSAAEADITDTSTIQFNYQMAGTIFCVDANMTTKNIQFNMNEKSVIASGACSLPVAGPTPQACFSTVANAIYDYYDNEGNNPANPACPRDVIIPSEIGGSVITAIEYAAMSGKGLNSVIISDTVTHVYDQAFSDNGMQSVTIPQTVTFIGAYSFTGNALTSVTIRADSVWGSPFDPGVVINYY